MTGLPLVTAVTIEDLAQQAAVCETFPMEPNPTVNPHHQ
jgi:hypothetical protein